MAKILLVEDDTNLSEIYQARMEAEGYEVVSAADGESALAIAAKEKPNLIISDVMMPKISGFEMLDILRNTDGLKNTPVIMLTALGQSDDRGRAEQLGADRYLVKSQVTLEDIVNAAHSILEGDDSKSAASSAPTVTSTGPVAVQAAPADPAPTGPLAPTEPVPVIAVATPPSDNPGPAPAATPTDDTGAPPAKDDDDTDSDGGSDTENLALAGSEPADPPAQNADATAADPLASAQTSEQEAAAINDKISGFERRPVTGPVDRTVSPTTQPQTPEATPEGNATAKQETPRYTPLDELLAQSADAPAPATSPAPASTPAPVPAQPAAPAPAAPATAPQPLQSHALDEGIVATAIDRLLQTNAPEAAPEHGRVLDSTDGPQKAPDRPLKKVITPIARPPELTLDELVAREEAKEIAASQILATAATAQPQQSAYEVTDIPSVVVGDDGQIVMQAGTTAAQPAPQMPDQIQNQFQGQPQASAADVPADAQQQPAQPQKPAFDPNSIAL